MKEQLESGSATGFVTGYSNVVDKKKIKDAESLQTFLQEHYDSAREFMDKKNEENNIAYEYYRGLLPKYNGYPTTAHPIVSFDVKRGVDGVVDPMMDIFTENEQFPVQLTPNDSTMPADQAKAITAHLSEKFLRKSQGTSVLHGDMVETGLLGNAFARAVLEEYEETETRVFKNEPIAKLVAMMKDFPDTDKDQFDINEEEGTFSTDDNGAEFLNVVRDISFNFTGRGDFAFERTAIDLDDARFTCQRHLVTKGFLRSKFPKEEELIEQAGLYDYLNWYGASNIEMETEKAHVDKGDKVLANCIDPEEQQCYLYEIEVTTSLVDGESKLYKVWTIASNGVGILQVEELMEHPHVKFKMFPTPDSPFDAGMFSWLKDKQDAKSRILNDRAYQVAMQAYGRMTAIKGAYDRKNLLDNRPGGVVEIQTAGAVVPIQYPQTSSDAGLLMQDLEKEIFEIEADALGVGEDGVGNMAATTAATLNHNAEIDIKSAGKAFAEGVKALFEKAYNLIRYYDIEFEHEGKTYKGSDLPKVCNFIIDVNTSQDNARLMAFLESAIQFTQSLSDKPTALQGSQQHYETVKTMFDLAGYGHLVDELFANPADNQPTISEMRWEMHKEQQAAELRASELLVQKLQGIKEAMEIAKMKSDVDVQEDEIAFKVQDGTRKTNIDAIDTLTSQYNQARDLDQDLLKAVYQDQQKNIDQQLNEKKMDMDAVLTQSMQRPDVSIS